MGLRWQPHTSASALHSLRSSCDNTGHDDYPNRYHETRRKPMRHAWLRCLPLLALLPSPASMAQTQKANSFTTLESNSATLQLPGSLTLTATVAPSKETGGMPSGNVQFFNNATHSLGTAPLKAIPATQNFSAPAINGSF